MWPQLDVREQRPGAREQCLIVILSKTKVLNDKMLNWDKKVGIKLESGKLYHEGATFAASKPLLYLNYMVIPMQHSRNSY